MQSFDQVANGIVAAINGEHVLFYTGTKAAARQIFKFIKSGCATLKVNVKDVTRHFKIRVLK